MNLKLMRLVCLLFVVNLTAQIQPSWYFDEANLPGPTRWMTNLPDGTLVSGLDIPGTHDSGSLYESFPGTSITQDLNISQQLGVGVRYLDIRCRMIDNIFTIHHGSDYQHMNFDDVLTDCKNFLQVNPGETIVMQIKPEHTTENCSLNFQQIFANYVRKYADLFYRDLKIPTLGEARGRIVLVRRFGWDNNVTPDLPIFGINGEPWADNTMYQIWNTGWGDDKVYLQDCYKHSLASHKFNAVWDFHKNVVNKTAANALLINYTSGTIKNFIPLPRTVADETNPDVYNLVTHPMAKYHKMGCIIMDFINADLAKAIYKNNFYTNVATNLHEGFVQVQPSCFAEGNTMENVVRVFPCPGMGSRFALKDLEWLGYQNDSMNSFHSTGPLTYRFWEHADFTGGVIDVGGQMMPPFCLQSFGWLANMRMSSMQMPSPLYNNGGGLFWRSSEGAYEISYNDKELTNDDDTKVYPNPSNGIFNIDFTSKMEVSKIEVYDEKGSLILSKAKEEVGNTIDLTKQPKGMYIVKIYTKNETIVKKIIRS